MRNLLLAAVALSCVSALPANDNPKLSIHEWGTFTCLQDESGKGIRAINAADLVLIPRKGEDKSDLADLRRTICADVLTNAATRVAEFDLPARDGAREDYHGSVDEWHDAVAAAWSSEIARHLAGIRRP